MYAHHVDRVFCLAVELGQYKGISPAQEIVNMMFRVGKFWEAVGTYCVCAAWLNCALKRLGFTQLNQRSFISTLLP
jgi:hypothetical protein